MKIKGFELPSDAPRWEHDEMLIVLIVAIVLASVLGAAP